MVFWILYTLVTLIFAAVLELNKNTLLGWVLLALLAAAFLIVRGRYINRALSWVCYIALFLLILFITWPPVKNVPAVSVSMMEETQAVKTEYGLVSGVYNENKTVEVFTGIPYAKPPVGELRWKAPEDPLSWEGVLKCDHFAPMSMQVTHAPIYDSLVRIIGYHDYKISLSDSWIAPVSEDSLYLNIWKPAGEHEKLPVIVYIHGGSLQTGQSWYNDYNGESFAEKGIVTVNMGYRLGVFGFLADENALSGDGTTGNYGLLDQIKALQWVRDNISAFGGDPDNVTIIGESAGAVCVDALCVSPLAKGLFRRAVLESSTLSSVRPPHSFRLLDEALESGKDLLARYKCSSLSELRNISAKKLVGEMNTQHHCTVDGYVLPDTPYNLRKSGVHNEEAILHGFNDKESGPFIIFDHANMKNYEKKIRSYFGSASDEILKLYNATTDEEADKYWAEIYGAVFFNYPHYCLNRLAVEQNIPVYEYLFTKSNGMLSSWHSGELIYAFANIPENSSLFDESDYKLSALMNSYWASFATDGDPNAENLSVFEENGSSTSILELGNTVIMKDEPYLELYKILDSWYGF
ncbi:MAG: carboxylesterase family protein [Sphaerochaetaceae bacterium]|nr:carboxylesterase family protein [Sphaerochaetaceae bacterium]